MLPEVPLLQTLLWTFQLNQPSRRYQTAKQVWLKNNNITIKRHESS